MRPAHKRQGSLPWPWAAVIYQVYPALVRGLERRRRSAICQACARSSTTCSGSASTRSGSSPTFPSPNVDWGYDVSDYLDVHPELGTLADLDALIADARDARHRRLARPRPEPHLRPARLVHRPPRVLRLVDRDPERLEVGLHRRDRLGVRRAAQALLPAPVRARAARPRLVEPRRARRVRADPPLLVRPRRRRLPHRRRARADQGPRAARRRRATCASAPRCTRSTRAGRRSPREYDPKPTLMGETYVALAEAAARTTSTSTSSQNFDVLQGRASTLDALRPIVEQTLATLPAGRDAALVRLEPRPLPPRDALGRRRRAQGARRALPAADAARRRDPLPGRRDRARATARFPPTASSTSPTRRATPSARRCRGRARGDEWREPWLPLGDTKRNVEDQRADPTSTLNYVRALIEQRARSPTRRTRRCRARRRLGLRARRHDLRAQPDRRVARHEGRPSSRGRA